MTKRWARIYACPFSVACFQVCGAVRISNRIHVFLCIAGTNDLQDLYDDLNIPFNQTDQTLRYKNAIDLLYVNPDVTNFVGHSLGGSVALELEKNTPNTYETTTYGAPVVSFKGGNRYRHKNDPISAFDFGAKSVGFNINPLEAHSFKNY